MAAYKCDDLRGEADANVWSGRSRSPDKPPETPRKYDLIA